MFTKIKYNDLNSRQKENYNFQKLAAKLAEYGYNCLWLNDDWQGADFIACHNDGVQFLKVQLKGRLTLDKKYLGKNIYVAFKSGEDWYLYNHDDFATNLMENNKTSSWAEKGTYHYSTIPIKHLKMLEPFKLI